MAAALLAVGAVAAGLSGHAAGAALLAVCALAVLSLAWLFKPRGRRDPRRD
jgi:hypothetical protein